MRVIAQHSCHIQLVRSKRQFPLTLSGWGWSGWSLITRVWLIKSHRGMYWTQISVSSVTQSCLTLCDPMDCSTPGFLVHHQLPELPQTHVHRVGDAIQPSRPRSSPSPPAFSLSQYQGLFQWVSSSHHVAKVLELQLQHQSLQWIDSWHQVAKISELQHQSFQWIFRIFSFRIDWFDLLPVQGTVKSLLQHRSSKASVLWHSAFFMVQVSHPYMTTGKTIALTRWTFVKQLSSN